MRPDERQISGMTPNVGDYDLDGYPDLYITEWGLLKSSEVCFFLCCHGLAYQGASLQNSASRLLHNLGPEKPGFAFNYCLVCCRLAICRFFPLFRYFEDVTMDAGVDMDRWRRGHAEAPGTFTFCSSFTVDSLRCFVENVLLNDFSAGP